MTLGYMVRAVHLRALAHLCVLRPNAAQAAQFDDFERFKRVLITNTYGNYKKYI